MRHTHLPLRLLVLSFLLNVSPALADSPSLEGAVTALQTFLANHSSFRFHDAINEEDSSYQYFDYESRTSATVSADHCELTLATRAVRGTMDIDGKSTSTTECSVTLPLSKLSLRALRVTTPALWRDHYVAAVELEGVESSKPFRFECVDTEQKNDELPAMSLNDFDSAFLRLDFDAPAFAERALTAVRAAATACGAPVEPF